MKRHFKLVAAMCAVAALCISSIPGTAAAAFEKNRIIDDPVFNNVGTMSAGDIDAFLNARNSCISPNSGFLAIDPTGYSPSTGYQYGGNVTAGTVIAHAAQAYDLNPQVLLVTLQKEQSLITTTPNHSNCNTRTISKAMGYACTDSYSPNSYSGVNLYTRHGTTYTSVDLTCVESKQKAGFSQQMIRAAWLLKFTQQRSLGNIGWAIVRGSWDNSDDLQSCYSGPVTQGWRQVCPSGSTTYYDGYTTIDGQSVHPESGATVALYRYTPHFHGNENFVSIWTSWFGSPYAIYDTLTKPRWMRVKANVQKYDIATDQPIQENLSAGQQIFFPTKISLYGKTFLRTQYDTERGYAKGVLLSDVEEIPWTAVDTPRWMQSNRTSSFQKIDPLNGQRIDAPIQTGQSVWIASKMVLNGKTYVRTQYDTDNNYSKSIPMEWLSDIQSATADTPRWMVTNKQTGFVSNPANTKTHTTDGSIAANTQVHFTQRIKVNNKWFVANDTDAQNNRFIPLSDLSYIQFTPMGYPHYMRTNSTMTKLDPASGEQIDPTRTTASGTDIMVVDTITINGTTYYRSQYDRDHGLYSAIQASALSEIPFEAAATPRFMAARKDIRKVDPRSGTLSNDAVIKKGQQIRIVSRITVNGVMYVRTEFDTTNNYSKAVRLSDLQEVQ